MWKSDRNLGVDMLHVGFYGERVSPVLEVKKRNFRHPSALLLGISLVFKTNIETCY